MSKFGRLPIPVMPKEEQNIPPVGNIGIVNLEQKKKPHNVTIKNYNQNEPRASPNMKYSDKQRYRRYKTKTEPNLLSKIQINEDDDIVNKIKEAFGIKTDAKNSNYSEPETTPAPFYKGADDLPVEPIANRRDEIEDITEDEYSELTYLPRSSLRLGTDYHFNTEFTPEKATKAEREFYETFYEAFPEDGLAMAGLSTPSDKAKLARMSAQLTPPSRLTRTPEEMRRAREEAKKINEEENRALDNELTLAGLDKLTSEYVTKRKVGRPEGSYGPVKRFQDALGRTEEENIEHFKTRKATNKLVGKPQKSLKELTDKRNAEVYKVFNDL